MKARRSLSPTTSLVLVILILVSGALPSASANEPPVAEAGLSRYASTGPLQLDGTASYDPDGSAPLSYAWRQLSGTPVLIRDANSPTPTIAGPDQKDTRGRLIPGTFPQTDAVQEWEFELVVRDGELASLPDTVKVIVVPPYGPDALRLQNPPFDVNKPTFIYFGGGDCVTGSGGQTWGDANWAQGANLVYVSSAYSPDSGGGRTYYRYADMIIVYLSSLAPDYKQPIQTSGWSTGGQPAIDVGLRLNRVYRDARYAVNRVTFFDATPYCRSNYAESIRDFLTSSVDGEQCWVDNYVGQNVRLAFPSTLSFGSTLSHSDVPAWYRTSLSTFDASDFNHGLVAGAYWSVIGPGKNLQLALTPDREIYTFRWVGTAATGAMSFFNESAYPGRLPEPVELGGWVNLSEVTGEIDGAVLSCRYSENATGYQILFGSDPYRVMDYTVVSDTPAPPMEILRDFPAGQTWWTIRVRDQYGSTIHADPIRLDLGSLPALSVENARTGKKYGLITHAIGDANSGDVLMLDPGTYKENVEFGGKTLTVRSLDPNDPEVVRATIIRGRGDAPAVTYHGPQSAGCILNGLTIQSETVGISCQDAAPSIRNCVVQSPLGIAVEFWHGRTPTLTDCTILGQVREGGDPGLIAYWKFDETEGSVARDSEQDSDAAITGTPLWRPADGAVDGALELDGTTFAVADPGLSPADGAFSVFAWVKGGAPGQTILSQQASTDWLSAASGTGVLVTELGKGLRTGSGLSSQAVITNGDWHHIGFTWDGVTRRLYADDVLVAEGNCDALAPSSSKLVIGSGKTMASGSCWSGLIDDVRLYNRAIKP